MQKENNDITEDLIIRYLNGELEDAHQMKKVEEWLENGNNLDEAKTTYKAWELSMLTAPGKKDPEKAFAALQKKIATEKKEAPVVKLSPWWYAAASIILAFTAWIFFFQTSDLPPDGTQEKDLVTTLVAKDSVSEYQLEDGSALTLNEASSLEYKPLGFQKGAERKVILDGVAYFEVEHQPGQPFIVKTRDAEVKVLGTKFMVKTSANKPTEVLVTEGKVQVTYIETAKRIVLSAKEEVRIKQVDQKVDVEVAPSDENHLYWKTGVMTFEEDSLGNVFETLASEFQKTIIAENNDVLSCNITATFKKQSLETIIQVIERTHQLQSYQQGDTIVILGDGCR